MFFIRESPNTLRNLSELAATKTLMETFKKAINALTIQDKWDAQIRDTIKLRQTRPFVAKGQADLDVPLKMERLRQWCEDINKAQSDVAYDFVYVDEENFDKYKPASFKQLTQNFREYK